jgi:hypothetical protein
MRTPVIFALAAVLALVSPSYADVVAVWPTLAPDSVLYGRFTQELSERPHGATQNRRRFRGVA